MKELFDKYFSLVRILKELEPHTIDIDSMTHEDSRIYQKKYQELYVKMIDLHFEIRKKLIQDEDNTPIVVGKDELGKDKTNTPEHIIDFSELRANVIQFKYLFPLNLKLSEFSEKKAFWRDVIVFVSSIIISALLGYVVNLTTPCWAQKYWNPCEENGQQKASQKEGTSGSNSINISKEESKKGLVSDSSK